MLVIESFDIELQHGPPDGGRFASTHFSINMILLRRIGGSPARPAQIYLAFDPSSSV